MVIGDIKHNFKSLKHLPTRKNLHKTDEEYYVSQEGSPHKGSLIYSGGGTLNPRFDLFWGGPQPQQNCFIW